MDDGLRAKAIEILGDGGRPERVVSDTSDFMSIARGDVILLGGRHYLVSGDESERGFGLDGEPKYWVKRTTELETGQSKIVKLVFFEKFVTKIGDIDVEFHRSPRKEATVLDVVRNHPHFMHGFTVRDIRGNEVRVIERIHGRSLLQEIASKSMDHEKYFFQELPLYLDRLFPCLEALGFLHDNGQVHGDVRTDHVFWDRRGDLFRWIDFDFDYAFPESPWSVDLFGVSNILSDLIALGINEVINLRYHADYADAAGRITADDLSLLDKGRIMNLGKLFPYVPDKLNRVLLHFARYAPVYFDNMRELLSDLGEAMEELRMDPRPSSQEIKAWRQR